MSYIYILSNDAMPDLLKVGMTSKEPDERARELSTTGVPSAFRVEAFWEVPNNEVSRTERRIHSEFRQYRFKSNREFFSVSTDKAKAIIDGFFRQRDEADKRIEQKEARRRQAEQDKRDRIKRIKALEGVCIQFVKSVTGHDKASLRRFLEHLIPAHTMFEQMADKKPLKKQTVSWEINCLRNCLCLSISGETLDGWQLNPWAITSSCYYSIDYFIYSGTMVKRRPPSRNSTCTINGQKHNFPEIEKQIMIDKHFPVTLCDLFALAGLYELKELWNSLLGKEATLL